ncbi:pectate lyase [Candidatus Sumerlaeota bacterium]|nr:pectate lyase [Candidatus Sumerlaeota bacterium]
MTRKCGLLLSLLFMCIQPVRGGIPVFPGAEGFGAEATGGRGGRVIEVTNLNDHGPGSLREAVTTTGTRIVVFRVAGYIDLESQLRIDQPDITVAGQTAPGDGICVRDYPTAIYADNVVVRYLRFRLGDKHNLKSDTFNITKRKRQKTGYKNVILDHCSISWGVDECASWYSNGGVTIQWCMIGEGLNYRGHSMGGLWGGQSTYHHNLIHSCLTRHPKFAYTFDEDITDHRNNVIYNWGDESAYTNPTGRVNVVANYYKYGPSTLESTRSQIVRGMPDKNGQPTKRLYVADNFVYGFPETTEDNWNDGVRGAYLRSDEPFPAPAVRTQTAEEAYGDVLAFVGASLPARDGVDRRVIDDVTSGTGRIIDRPSDVGGYPELRSGPAVEDSDRDGMPDAWESKYGLNANDASDGPADKDGDGYTNVEEFLNGTIPTEHVDYTKPENNVSSLHRRGN